ncbi:hypothetical protein TNCV_3675511 [Trichonephila clavipes]|nr:hypothetical protein TNCV_3675511 [Trichonephila clavipes]
MPHSSRNAGIKCFKQGNISFFDDERYGTSSTSTTEDNVKVVQDIVMEEMAGKEHRYYIFRKQKANPCLHFLLGADRQCSCHVELSATLQRLQERRVIRCIKRITDNTSFSVGY